MIGIFSLLGNKNYTQIEEIDIKLIDSSPYQTRVNFQDIEELASSIKEHSLLQPLTVVEYENNKYRLIAGERRLLAMKSLGLKTVPAIVKTISEEQHLFLTLIENIQRNGLHPVEEAEAYNLIIRSHNYTHEDLAKKLGKSRSHISNILRINKLNEDTKKNILEKNLSFNQIRDILSPKTHIPTDKETFQSISKNFPVNKIIEKDRKNTSSVSFVFKNYLDKQAFLQKLAKFNSDTI